MNKKKIYISLPIAFHEDTVYQRNQDAKDYLSKKYKKQVLYIELALIAYEAYKNSLKV